MKAIHLWSSPVNNTTAKNQDMTWREKERAFAKAGINWIPAIFLIGTGVLSLILVPWYLLTHSVSTGVWVAFVLLLIWTGMSITAGYHRYWSHRAYNLHPIVQYFLLWGASMAVESSAYDWCSGHRDHHRYVDDEHADPYSSARGFFFSHIGWMLKKYPSGQYDYKNIPDLKKSRLLAFQHKHYALCVTVTNLVTLSAIGFITGDFLGTFIIAGLLRLVIMHHTTFFINSLCHMVGTRPYTDTNTARDNALMALLTWGEGYHNYHHFFQYDYRNGVKWWQYDPTKWLIAILSKIGLASDLKRVDDVTIKHAQAAMQFKNAQKRTQGSDIADKIAAEYEAFCQTVSDWQAIKTQAMAMKKNEFKDRIHEVDERLKSKYTEIETRLAEHTARLGHLVK